MSEFREKVLDIVLSDRTIIIVSSILFSASFVGALGASWTWIITVGIIGGLAGAFYSTFQ